MCSLDLSSAYFAMILNTFALLLSKEKTQSAKKISYRLFHLAHFIFHLIHKGLAKSTSASAFFGEMRKILRNECEKLCFTSE